MIANSDVYYKSEGYPTEEEKRRKGLFEIKDVAEAMHLYLNVYSIEECLTWENPLVYLFAILDRRVGKRTLIKINREKENKPQWLWRFLELRLEAENIESVS